MVDSTGASIWLEHACPSTQPDDLQAMFDALERDLAAHGLRPADVVRNRLLAATREGRDAASRIRFARLSGPARCATSSYIDPSRFPTPDGARIETLAVAGAGAVKIAVEHDPPQPPCRFVAADGRVVLAGLTSLATSLDTQFDEISRRATETLALAETRLAAPVRVTAAAAWVHRSVADSRLRDLPSRLGLTGVPFRVERCDGYSKPGKLIEVEIDAVVGG